VVIWILFVEFCAFLHFGPYSYSYLRIGSDHEELTDGQDYPEAGGLRRDAKFTPSTI
jgi:hypothetical protein